MVRRIVSGGQTGVDRAALDVALALGIDVGGWCPKGRKAEDGPIDLRYPLTETPETEYAQRTAWNVRDADATLVLVEGSPSGGTAQTIAYAAELAKPCLVVDLQEDPHPETVQEWLQQHAVRVLNVAGPRESRCPGIAVRAGAFLQRCLAWTRNES